MERYEFTKKELFFAFLLVGLLIVLFSVLSYGAGLHDKKCEKITIEILPPKTLNNSSGGFAGPVQPWCDKEFFTQYGYCNQTEVKK